MYKRMSIRDIEMLFGIEIPSYDACSGKNRDGITEKQKIFIHDLGINVTGLKYKGQAAVVIDCILDRRAKGFATMRQLQTIRNLGIRTKKPFQALTKNEASRILAQYL